MAEFKKHFETKNNFILDSDGDYTKSLEAADVIISDYTSLIIEELLMDVPVIYTGSTKHFGKKAKANAVGLYQLDSRKDMNKVLTGLLKGVDPMKAIRQLIYSPSIFHSFVVISECSPDCPGDARMSALSHERSVPYGQKEPSVRLRRRLSRNDPHRQPRDAAQARRGEGASDERRLARWGSR